MLFVFVYVCMWRVQFNAKKLLIKRQAKKITVVSGLSALIYICAYLVYSMTSGGLAAILCSL